MDAKTPRQRYLERHQFLKTERSSWDAHWKELAEHILPRRSRFQSSERNKGEKKSNQTIINGTPTWSARVLAAGMMAGITSPARPWFRLTTPDPEMAEFGPVREWLHVCEERLRMAFARSNTYMGLQLVYQDLGVFGSTAMLLEEDQEDVLRTYVFPVGQYCLATSERLAVDTIFRELSMTVRQVVRMFGLESCSRKVQDAYREHRLDEWVDVLHLIEPNSDVQPGKLGVAGQRFKSCWLEKNCPTDEPGFLREAGYHEFPLMAPRWTVTGEDVYGASPGMEALGDCRALQVLEKRKAMAVDKIVNPPMAAPSALMNQRATLLPGDVTYVDAVAAGQGFRPAHEVPPMAVQVVGAEILRHEERIKTAFYADLWLMLSQSDSPQMTAREVAERHEEKLLQLGPVLERLQDELLDPLIDRAFGILLRNGMLPEAPEELSGSELRVEYISMMAQAQKLLGTSSIERLASFVGNLAAVKSDVLDKVNFDELVDEYGNALGVKPDLIRTDEEVAELRAERADQVAQAQAAESAANAVQGAKVLSETDMQGDTALSRLVNNIGGVAAAAGTVQ